MNDRRTSHSQTGLDAFLHAVPAATCCRRSPAMSLGGIVLFSLLAYGQVRQEITE